MVDNPITRKEKYLAKLTGSYTGNVPDPITRVEKYLYDLCQKGISGLTPEEIENAVNKYLEGKDYVTKTDADKAYQPAGSYLSGTDEDLAVSGKAADAKAVGNAVAKIEGINYTDRGTLADTDAFLVNDGTGMKKSVLSKLSDWILNKLADKTFQKLATSNKTILGAINDLNSVAYHNIPRIVPKDVTSYYNDGSLWKRLGGTDGYSLFEDLFVGDYFKMSRPISAPNPVADYQLTGSQYVTFASFGGLAGNGDKSPATDKWAVMVPGMGFGGTQHFGRSRMNPTNTAEGAYKGSEMNIKVIGPVVTAGSTAAGATINQQLFAEFGSHLATTRELVSNSINATGVNKFGAATGCSNNWEWADMQAVLMSEIEVYGSVTFSSSGFDTGTANHQFELFVFSKNAINNRSAWYFLKDAASASQFCNCNNNGRSSYGDASGANGYVRPRFVIKA